MVAPGGNDWHGVLNGRINSTFLDVRRARIVRNRARWRTCMAGECMAGELRQTSFTDDAASHHVPATIRWYDLAMTVAAETIAGMQDVVTALHTALPDLQAIYLFGSQASGDAGPDSDIDLAVLTGAPRDSVTLWELSADLALLCGLHVDLLDLRSASTVMQYQVITTGERIWASDSSAALYESFILSEKTSLDEARAGLLQDIASRGRVHG